MPATETGSTNRAAGSDLDAAKAICLRSFEVVRVGTLEDFEEVVHPKTPTTASRWTSPPKPEAAGPPLGTPRRCGCATPSPISTSRSTRWWPRATSWSSNNTMSGRHVKAFLDYDEHARVREAFPPTGKRFATKQTHWFRVRDGKVIEHWANRDDMGTALQLGWVPPTPLYMLRMGDLKAPRPPCEATVT